MAMMDDRVSAVGSVRDEDVGVVLRPFEEFFLDERDRLFRALVLVTRDTGVAEELMQEAFVRIWERWDRVSGLDDPTAYLFRTALNLHRSALRHALVVAKRSLTSRNEHDPFDEIAARDEAVRSLAALTPRQRAALVVTELLGYSSEEAGAILGIRPGTVRTLTARARTILHERKDQHG